MKIKSLLLIAAAVSLPAVPAMADTYDIFNDTTGASVFNRPTQAGDALSDFGSAVPYYAQIFSVNLSGNYDFSAHANTPSSFDTFIHVYSGSFNPSAPLNNFLAANDDASASPDLGSALNGLTLLAGNSYTFVIDGFGDSDFGQFKATISGPGTISPVPEPAALTLVGLGLMGFCLARRRH